MDAPRDAPSLRSTADPSSEAFLRYTKEHGELVDEQRLAAARLGGPERARARHTERGKLLPRATRTTPPPGSGTTA